MVVRSLRISPGLRGAPPIAATPRAFISSLRVSLSFATRSCDDSSRSSLVFIRPSLSLELLQLVLDLERKLRADALHFRDIVQRRLVEVGERLVAGLLEVLGLRGADALEVGELRGGEIDRGRGGGGRLGLPGGGRRRDRGARRAGVDVALLRRGGRLRA